ncbi:dihydroneopterin aldolase [Porphyromonas cangingivalis]|uniref:7,8-dihydroneopterin aldolase n=1 Tax=Porphyromonas cangingivalis TaxID=36874 RepID=A0A1T4LKL4_PORCN|nr:dihydroneopterin aldolase [Porphyromonas cangingivalis]SJZ55245.1 dihydroneopterin aldolase [Porphyromonas cangingivalis]SPY34517.1 Dihydroneopterin aldolase [Porphyromonas cangingivalis]VEJ02976.1 Dihydroneopterin aldolase [Porphyromonas cangingivalis]
MEIKETKIRLERVVAYARHGVMPHETLVGNEFYITLEVVFDATQAMKDDQLSGTINYADLYTLIQDEMKTPSELIEHVAGRILSRLEKEYPMIMEALIEIEKNSPPIPNYQAQRLYFSAKANFNKGNK